MKKFLLSCAFGGFALFANAAYLQWQVDTDYDGGDWNYVSVYLVNSTDSRTLLTNYSTTDGSEVGNTIDKATALSDETYIINVGEAETYSFYVEYYKWSTALPETHAELSNAVVGVGKFTATSDNTYDTTSLSIEDLPTNSAAWPTPVSYTASVPEPTSGLLMLFGAAMLGLKRKNRSRA